MDVHPWKLLAEINPRTVVDVLEAALTPVIAVVTVFIAYNQWRVNKIRLDVELYDRRLAVYKAVDAFYEEVGKHGTANYPMVSELRQHTVEAAFLFPTGVEEHLMEVSEKAMRTVTLRELMYPSTGGQGLPAGEERSKAAEEEKQLVLWLLQEAKPESKKRFGKYLKLT